MRNLHKFYPKKVPKFKNLNFTCKLCGFFKMQKRIYFKSPTIYSQSLMQVVVTDIFSFGELKLYGDIKYYIVFVECFSRFTMVYPLKRKTDVVEVIKKYIIFAQQATQRQLAYLLMDPDPNFKDAKVQQALITLCVNPVYCTPNEHNLIGIAENCGKQIRRNYPLMLATANLSSKWSYQSVHCYIQYKNMIPNRHSINTTNAVPYELFLQQKLQEPPTIIFGTNILVYNSKYNEKQHISHSYEAIFLHYNNPYLFFKREYTCLNIATQKLVNSSRIDIIKPPMQFDTPLVLPQKDSIIFAPFKHIHPPIKDTPISTAYMSLPTNPHTNEAYIGDTARFHATAPESLIMADDIKPVAATVDNVPHVTAENQFPFHSGKRPGV